MPATLLCLPASLCSWRFRVREGRRERAALEFSFFTEQGAITLDDIRYEVVKHGVASGRWTLQRDGQIAAAGYKPSALFRRFEVAADGVRIDLKAQSPFTRRYEMLIDGRRVGAIAPVHPFTRRATIECDDQVPTRAQIFCFWLVALTWRRAARSNNGGT